MSATSSVVVVLVGRRGGLVLRATSEGECRLGDAVAVLLGELAHRQALQEDGGCRGTGGGGVGVW